MIKILIICFNDFFSIPPGYYGLEHVILTLAYMALCRIKCPEQLRHQPSGELGKTIGLDRIPEVKTIRNKLAVMTDNFKNVEEWSLKLSQNWMNDFPEYAGILYVDGHSKLYSGKLAKLPRKYFSRLRLCMRGTNVYYIVADRKLVFPESHLLLYFKKFKFFFKNVIFL